MSAMHLMAVMLGLFAVPLWLLAVGHRLWRKSLRLRRLYLGVVLGHCLALVAATSLAVLPPHMWAPTDVTRGAVGAWGLVVFPLIGGLLAVLIRSSNRDGAR